MANEVFNPGGEILPFLSARKRTQIIDTVFDEIGGAQALADVANLNDENRKWFYTLWAKGAARPMLPANSAPKDGRIEELLARLDAGESATVINGDDNGA